MPEQSLISESLSRILGMQPGGGITGGAPNIGNSTSAGTAEEGRALGRSPLSYISGAVDEFGMGSAFGQQARPSTVQTVTNIAPVTPVAAAPPANPLTVTPSISATAPKPAAPAAPAYTPSYNTSMYVNPHTPGTALWQTAEDFLNKNYGTK